LRIFIGSALALAGPSHLGISDRSCSRAADCSDETIFLTRRKRPETVGALLMIHRIKEAIMPMLILDLIYREFLKSAVLGMANLGGRQR
jgi:hypothetical protein